MKHPFNRVVTLLFVLALLAGSARTDAALVLFSGFDVGAGSTDPRPNSDAAASSFDAAVGTFGLITFEDAPLGAFGVLNVAPGVSLTGSDVGGSNQTIRNTPVGTPDERFGYNTTSGGSQWASAYGGSLEFTFSTPVTAFGLYLSGLQGDAVGNQMIVYTGLEEHVIDIPSLPSDGGIAFVGFIDTTSSFSGVLIELSNDIVGIDDVRYDAPAVPEPMTLTLFGAGLAVLAFGRRR